MGQKKNVRAFPGKPDEGVKKNKGWSFPEVRSEQPACVGWEVAHGVAGLPRRLAGVQVLCPRACCLVPTAPHECSLPHTGECFQGFPPPRNLHDTTPLKQQLIYLSVCFQVLYGRQLTTQGTWTQARRVTRQVPVSYTSIYGNGSKRKIRESDRGLRKRELALLKVFKLNFMDYVSS